MCDISPSALFRTVKIVNATGCKCSGARIWPLGVADNDKTPSTVKGQTAKFTCHVSAALKAQNLLEPIRRVTVPEERRRRSVSSCTKDHWLVAWNIFYDFPYIGNSHPNIQLTNLFQRGRYTTNQIRLESVAKRS